MIVSLPWVGRPVDGDSFVDLTSVPVRVQHFAGGGVTLLFDADLTVDARVAVVQRCQSGDDVEATFRSGLSTALERCEVFLANPAPTGADMAEQLRLLTRMVVAVVRLVVRRRGGD